jgi:hypothetical protein
MVMKIVQHHHCPITRELVIDPVVAEDGHIYERVDLERWLQTKKRSPVTNKPMGSRVVPAIFARQTIQELLESGAVDDSTAAKFFYTRAQNRATRSSAPGPDFEGAKEDLARAAGLRKGLDTDTEFHMNVIDWMVQGVELCSKAAKLREDTKRWMIEVGNAVRFAIMSPLFQRMTEWQTLSAGTRVRVIDDALELQQLCERPPPGATAKVNWNPDMLPFAGEVCTVRSMGQASHMNYILSRAGASFSFPYDAVILIP